MRNPLANYVANWQLKRAYKLWHQRRDDAALRAALSAAKHIDSAKVVAAQWLGVSGNWEAAIPLLEAAARNGMWEAKQVLSSCYTHGDGVAIDIDRSYELAAEAAELGSIDCQVEMARYYSDGKLREPNYALAMKYARMAAENGEDGTLIEVQQLRQRRGE